MTAKAAYPARCAANPAPKNDFLRKSGRSDRLETAIYRLESSFWGVGEFHLYQWVVDRYRPDRPERPEIPPLHARVRAIWFGEGDGKNKTSHALPCISGRSGRSGNLFNVFISLWSLVSFFSGRWKSISGRSSRPRISKINIL